MGIPVLISEFWYQLQFYPDWRPGRPVSIAGPPIGTCRAL